MKPNPTAAAHEQNLRVAHMIRPNNAISDLDRRHGRPRSRAEATDRVIGTFDAV
jgi:hypothetical protein